MNNRIAITAGDFNGIGPEIIVKALNKLNPPREQIVLIGAKELFRGLENSYEIIEIPLSDSVGEFSYQCILKACELAKEGIVSSIVTAPVSKNELHKAGHNFSGQTEILEKELSEKGEKAEMLFTADDFRVLLLTRHLALKDVKITKELLIEKLDRINQILKDKFKIAKPKIALCALNPHAGENGILGSDEIEEFTPALKILRGGGVNVSDPLPADTLFVKASTPYLKGEKQPYDCYVACYHDQGLIPIKVLAMDKTVNTTVGLCVIRTSPAHGTANDIAGKGIADESSMIEAVKSALHFTLD